MWRQKVTHQALEEGEAEYSIRDVWADNLEDEMGYIRELLEEYPYIAMACAIAGVFVVSLCFFFFRIRNFRELLLVPWATSALRRTIIIKPYAAMWTY